MAFAQQATTMRRNSNACGVCDDASGKASLSSRNAALMAAAFLAAVLPFEIEHLLTMLAAALAYVAISKLHPRVPAKPRVGKKLDVLCTKTSRKERKPSHCQAVLEVPQAAAKPLRTVSAQPVAAPVFHSAHWDAEVMELLVQITPTAECEQTVAHLAETVKREIRTSFPDADVVHFAFGNLRGGKAFGVAVPDVEIVANLCPQSMTRQMMAKGSSGRDVGHLDSRQLQKYALRASTELLTAKSGFKFRRSAFRGDEPKVTFLAPAGTASDVAVPFDFSFNSSVPLHCAAIMMESGEIDARAKQLILLVRRWAKDRGVCHFAKGHLSPYMWTLLAVYYLQAGVKDGSILPPLKEFKVASGLMQTKNKSQKTASAREEMESNALSVGSLLKGFFSFYADEFDWSREVVDVASGCRAASDREAALPRVGDPFASKQNIASHMTQWSYERLQEEFARARDMVTQATSDPSLATLLEPWAPAEATAAATA